MKCRVESVCYLIYFCLNLGRSLFFLASSNSLDWQKLLIYPKKFDSYSITCCCWAGISLSTNDPQISSYVSVFAINNVWSKNEKHSYKFVLKGPVKTQPTFRLLTYIRCHRYYNIGFIINQSCWDEKIWFCTNLSWKLQITSIKWPDTLFSGIIP